MPHNQTAFEKSRETAAIIALLAVVPALVVFGLNMVGAFEPVEQKAYDGLFFLKAKISPTPMREKPFVAVIGIDDKTLDEERFKIPRIMWHRYFSTVIGGLVDSGAKVVGPDFLLPQGLFDELAPGYSATWLKMFVYAKSKGIPIITGVIQAGDRTVTPHPIYQQIAGPESFGLVNLTIDGDDFTRRQRLFFPYVQEPDQGAYSYGFLLARAYEPDIPLPSPVIRIDFNTSPRPFVRVSFSEVYQHIQDNDTAWMEDRFSGRIVLIGETDSLTQDRHPTPLYYLSEGFHKRTPGVEIVGHVVDTLLSRRYFKQSPDIVNLLIFIGLCLVISGVTLQAGFRHLLYLLPVSIVVYALVSLLLYCSYIIVPVAAAGAALVLSQAVSFSYRYWVVERAQKKAERVSAELKHKLELAMEVQQSLLPSENPVIEGLDVAGRSVYCDETGGDYYDFLIKEDEPAGRIGLILGDVSDHGIPSALLMTTARAFLRQRANMPGDIASIVSDVNDQLCRDVEESGRFMTFVYCELDVKASIMRWVNAGHDPVIVYDSTKDTFEEMALRGPALGLFEDFDYRKFSREISPGQVVVLATDGVWEAHNPDGEQFGKDAFKALIREHSSKPTQEIVDIVIDKVENHLSPNGREDDITLIVAKVIRDNAK